MAIYNDVLIIEDLLNNAYDQETGEFNELDLEAGEQLKTEIIKQGMERICMARANIKSNIDALKSEKLRIAKKQQTEENNLERLEKYMMLILKSQTEEKIKAGTFTVGTRKSKSVFLSDNFENKDFGIYEFKADKTAIKKAIEGGQVVDGAIIVENESVSVR